MLTHLPHFEMFSTSKDGKVSKTHKPVYITDIFDQFKRLDNVSKPSNIFFTFGNVSYVFYVLNVVVKRDIFNQRKFKMDLIITDIRHSKKNNFSDTTMKYVFHCNRTLFRDDCIVIMNRILNNREKAVDIYDTLADALTDPIHAKMIDGIVLEMVKDSNSNLYKIEAYIENLQLPSYSDYENYVVFKYDKPMTENVKEFINNIAISSYLPDDMLSLNEGISEYNFFVNNATFGIDIGISDDKEEETEEKSTDETKKEKKEEKIDISL